MNAKQKLIFYFLLIEVVASAIDTSGCGSSKRCVRNIANCDLSNSTCLFFSYAWDPNNDTFVMELSGGAGDESQYHGVAFSLDENMTDADLYLCTGMEVISGVIRTRSTPTIDDALPPQITSVSSSTTEGVAECTFQRARSVSKVVNGEVTEDFDLIERNFYILQAFGPYSNGTLTYHNENRWPSTTSFNFSLNAANPSPSTQTSSITPTGSMMTMTEDPTANCNTAKKGCFHNPRDCVPGIPSCMFASWSYNNVTEAYDFSIIGGTSNSGQYVAIAFTSAPLMEDADLYYCTENQVTSAVIRTRWNPPVVLESTNVLSNTVTGLNQGVLMCSFSRARSVNKIVSNGVNKNFNLSSEHFHLLFAVGETQTGGTLTRHTARTASRNSIDFLNDGNFMTMNYKMLLGMYLFGISLTFLTTK